MSIKPRRLKNLRNRIAERVATQTPGYKNSEERDYEFALRLAILKLLEAEESYTPFMAVQSNGHIATTFAMFSSTKK